MPLDQDPTQDESPLSGFMSLGGHLDELRGRLIKAIIVPLVLGCALFAGGNYVRNFLVQPLMEALAAQGQPTNLQVLSPTETLMVDLKVAIWASLTLFGSERGKKDCRCRWRHWSMVAGGLFWRWGN